MRLLVVGHSYLLAFSQPKYIEMKRQHPGLELRILAPRAIPHPFQRYERQRADGISAEELVDIRDFFGSSHMSYVLDPVRFAKVLREFRPHRIHIEEDPHSMIGAETVLLARLFCPKAKIGFFILDNLAHVPRFPLNIVKKLLTRFSLKRADLVICGSLEAERLLCEKKGYRGRTAVLPQLGLPPELFRTDANLSIRDKLSVPPGVPLLGFAGRLVEEKGIRVLLEALQDMRDVDWHLLVIGSGPLEDELRGKWQDLFGSRLSILKAVPHAELPAYVKAMDVLILPSYGTPRWKEQFGQMLLYAMLSGVPCVGSSSGAIPEVIGPGGLVFKEKDSEDLVRTLKRLLADEALRQQLATQAKDFAWSRYTHEAVSGAYLEQFLS